MNIKMVNILFILRLDCLFFKRIFVNVCSKYNSLDWSINRKLAQLFIIYLQK